MYLCGYYLLLAYVPPFSHFISPTFLPDQGRKHENVDYLWFWHFQPKLGQSRPTTGDYIRMIRFRKMFLLNPCISYSSYKGLSLIRQMTLSVLLHNNYIVTNFLFIATRGVGFILDLRFNLDMQMNIQELIYSHVRLLWPTD